MSKSELYKQRREELKALSAGARILVKEGVYDSVNEFVLEHYRDQTGAEEFNTFHQWREKGFKVKKGSKAFAVWGSPRKGHEDPETKSGESEEDEYKFFPLCYLFSDQQVEPAMQMEAVS